MPQVAASVATHAQTVPELTHEVKAASLPIASKELLTAAWKAWLQEAGTIQQDCWLMLARSSQAQSLALLHVETVKSCEVVQRLPGICMSLCPPGQCAMYNHIPLPTICLLACMCFHAFTV